MEIENKFSGVLEDSLKDEIKETFVNLVGKLSPVLIEFADGEARKMACMGDKSYAFVIKTLEYARQYPEFAGLIDVAELENNLKDCEALRELYIPLAQLLKKVRDTMILLGNKAFTGSLAYYGMAKEGRKRRKPNSILWKTPPDFVSNKADASMCLNAFLRKVEHGAHFERTLCNPVSPYYYP